MSAPDLRPVMTLSAISRRLASIEFLAPAADTSLGARGDDAGRGARSPESWRARTPANEPTICIIIPAHGWKVIVVSMFSVNRAVKPAPAVADPLHDLQQRHFSDRDSRSSFQTTIRIAFAQLVEHAVQISGGYSSRRRITSSNNRRQPAALSAWACRRLFCSSPFETRHGRAKGRRWRVCCLSQTAVYERAWATTTDPQPAHFNTLFQNGTEWQGLYERHLPSGTKPPCPTVPCCPPSSAIACSPSPSSAPRMAQHSRCSVPTTWRSSGPSGAA